MNNVNIRVNHVLCTAKDWKKKKKANLADKELKCQVSGTMVIPANQDTLYVTKSDNKGATRLSLG
jgi:hypothetical protein